MKNTLPNNDVTRNALQHLIEQQYYVGELNENGFILKRNFGNRRQPIFGVLNNENHFDIKVKNEVFHQIFYIFGALLLLSLSVFLFVKQNYPFGLLVFGMIFLIYASDRNQRKKELDLFTNYILEFEKEKNV